MLESASQFSVRQAVWEWKGGTVHALVAKFQRSCTRVLKYPELLTQKSSGKMVQGRLLLCQSEVLIESCY